MDLVYAEHHRCCVFVASSLPERHGTSPLQLHMNISDTSRDQPHWIPWQCSVDTLASFKLLCTVCRAGKIFALRVYNRMQTVHRYIEEYAPHKMCIDVSSFQR